MEKVKNDQLNASFAKACVSCGRYQEAVRAYERASDIDKVRTYFLILFYCFLCFFLWFFHLFIHLLIYRFIYWFILLPFPSFTFRLQVVELKLRHLDEVQQAFDLVRGGGSAQGAQLVADYCIEASGE